MSAAKKLNPMELEFDHFCNKHRGGDVQTFLKETLKILDGVTTPVVLQQLRRMGYPALGTPEGLEFLKRQKI
ncbi:hypothetical protein KKG46_04785 [Patescibacteria group bacterium]|nr:hypothetical protein [Patescibacteria group bacterium]